MGKQILAFFSKNNCKSFFKQIKSLILQKNKKQTDLILRL
jgi:hypothetical protein